MNIENPLKERIDSCRQTTFAYRQPFFRIFGGGIEGAGWLVAAVRGWLARGCFHTKKKEDHQNLKPSNIHDLIIITSPASNILVFSFLSGIKLCTCINHFRISNFPHTVRYNSFRSRTNHSPNSAVSSHFILLIT